MAELPTRDEFAEHLNQTFVLTIEDRSVVATLDRVSDLERSGPSESFSLFFEAPGDSQLQQNLYKVSHPDLGEVELFLVPVALDERGLRMQAVFNRLTV